MNWQTLLVPLDGSPLAEAALPYAEAVARATAAPITLLSVLDDFPLRESSAASAPEIAARGEIDARLTQTVYLRTTAVELINRGLDASPRLAEGTPAYAILSAADELDASLIVMATHGRGGAVRWLLGSVADKVMRLSARPVLLVRQPAQPAAAEVTLQQIAVPLDGSPLAEAALPLAADLVRAAGATVTLLRVDARVESLMPMYTSTGHHFDLAEMDAKVTVDAEAYLAGMRRRLPPDVRVETMLLRGVPGRTLIDVLAGGSTDLVVMSTRGWGGLRRLALGSMADRLVRAGVPTILVRSSGEQQALAPNHAAASSDAS